MYLVGLIAVASAFLVLLNVRSIRKQRDYVRPDRPALHYSAVQIVCGDCAGEGISPAKTFMDRHGRCDRCGGSSYILASERGLALRHAMAKSGLRIATDESAPAPAAVSPSWLEAVPEMRIAV